MSRITNPAEPINAPQIESAGWLVELVPRIESRAVVAPGARRIEPHGATRLDRRNHPAAAGSRSDALTATRRRDFIPRRRPKPGPAFRRAVKRAL